MSNMNESENPSFVQGPSTLTRMLATYLSQLSSPGQAPSTITCMTMTYLSQLPPWLHHWAPQHWVYANSRIEFLLQLSKQRGTFKHLTFNDLQLPLTFKKPCH
jgi:hypothetical protein